MLFATVECVAPALAADIAVPAAPVKLLTAENGVALVTLTLMEIVLGIDNIVFIAILCARLPEHQREKARVVGLFLAMFLRIGLLLLIKFIIDLAKKELFTIPVLNHGFTAKDLVLLAGGLFLVYKATTEIYHKVEGEESRGLAGGKHASFGATIFQILGIDIVFSLDSVITAVGMARSIHVMVTAVVISVLVMLLVSGKIAAFIHKHPSLKMLALSFLLLIGVMLIGESMGQHIGKGYIYAAMMFSLIVEVLNILARRKHHPVISLHPNLPPN